MLKQNVLRRMTALSFLFLSGVAFAAPEPVAPPTPLQVMDGMPTPEAPKFAIVAPTKIESFISRFGGDVSLDPGSRGEIRFFGLVSKDCVRNIRITVGNFNSAQRLYPVTVEKIILDEATDPCTKERLDLAIENGTVVDLADYKKSELPHLILGTKKLDQSGHVKLVGASRCSKGSSDADCFDTQSINGIADQYRTLKDEQIAEDRAEAAAREAEIAALCLDAANGSRPAFETLKEVYGPSMRTELRGYEDKIIDKELADFDARIAKDDAASVKLDLVSELRDYALANKDDARIQQSIIEKLMLLAVVSQNSGIIDSKSKMTRDPEKAFQIRKRSYEAILKLDPQNSEVYAKLQDLPLDIATDRCGEYASLIQRQQSVSGQASPSVSRNANSTLMRAAKACDEAFSAAREKADFLAIKSMRSDDERLQDASFRYQSFFQPQSEQMPWFNPMTGQTENVPVQYATSIHANIARATQQASQQGGVASSSPSDIYRWQRGNGTANTQQYGTPSYSYNSGGYAGGAPNQMPQQTGYRQF